jgi:hypothetical protein
MAEVDVLLACLQAAAGRETYAPGLLAGEANVRNGLPHGSSILVSVRR